MPTQVFVVIEGVEHEGESLASDGYVSRADAVTRAREEMKRSGYNFVWNKKSHAWEAPNGFYYYIRTLRIR